MDQIEKNTVSAKKQLKESEYISYMNPDTEGLRVLYVGNSITLHGINENIGWTRLCGMAASSVEKDYVHILSKRISDLKPASFCICQNAKWEVNYKNGTDTLSLFEAARDFDADIIILRSIENCPYKDFDAEAFKLNYKALVDYLNKSGKAKIILTTGFWKHTGDSAIKEVAAERNYPCVYLGDLGEDDAMKAAGLFSHDGVAAHPGDKGMQAIADRIFPHIESVI